MNLENKKIRQFQLQIFRSMSAQLDLGNASNFSEAFDFRPWQLQQKCMDIGYLDSDNGDSGDILVTFSTFDIAT